LWPTCRKSPVVSYSFNFILYSLLILLLLSRRPESLIGFVGIRTVSKPGASTVKEARKRDIFRGIGHSPTKQS
jgi:hypothetical protein